jgi:hypothetical protein
LLDLAANTETGSNTLRFTDTDILTVADQQIGKIEFYSADVSSPGAGVKAYIGAFATDTSPDAYIAFATDNGGTLGERVRITNTGAVGIGTTAPGATLDIAPDANRNLQVLGRAATTYGIELKNATSFATSEFHITAASSGSIIFNRTTNESARIDSSGRLLVGTSSDSGGALLQVNGDRVRIASAKTPASASATGTAGEICWDANYIYVCTATDTWKRSAISTW